MRSESSAGGIVYRNDADKIMILVCQHSHHHGWVFPKGLIGDHIEGESKESTALREVEEETGAKAEIITHLKPVTYWYFWNKEKIKKTVYYYVMKYISGDITKHDWEMENVEWIETDKVEERLTYAADKKVWREAEKLISNF